MSDHHNTQPDYGTGTKTLGIYVTGIVLCIILTLIPFMVVMHDTLPHWEIALIIFPAAVLQFLVQVICFLRLNVSSNQSKMNVMSFVFSIVVLVVLIGGSAWIMFSLNYRMMH